MEIPIVKDRGSESGGGLDFLFQFSPVRTEENQVNPGAETSRLPVRGDTVEVSHAPLVPFMTSCSFNVSRGILNYRI